MSDVIQLATFADYVARFGPIDNDDASRIETLLSDASSFVRQVTRHFISEVTGDVETIDGDGTHTVFLKELPVTNVTSVVVDGTALDADDFYWYESGKLIRKFACWPCTPRSIVVTYDHGYEEIDDWLIGFICAMVSRSSQPYAQSGIRSEGLGDHQITYQSTSGAQLWITDDEAARLNSLSGPIVF